MQKLYHHFQNIEHLISANFDTLIEVDEIGDKIALSVVDYFNDEMNIKNIQILKEIGLQLILIMIMNYCLVL